MHATAEAPSLDSQEMQNGAPHAEQPAPRCWSFDDSAVHRRLAGSMIQKATGLRAVYAANGREALEQIAREAPAVVMTDLQMPEMGGLELVTQIRERFPQRPDRPDDRLRQRGGGHAGPPRRCGQLRPQEEAGHRPGRHPPRRAGRRLGRSAAARSCWAACERRDVALRAGERPRLDLVPDPAPPGRPGRHGPLRRDRQDARGRRTPGVPGQRALPRQPRGLLRPPPGGRARLLQDWPSAGGPRAVPRPADPRPGPIRPRRRRPSSSETKGPASTPRRSTGRSTRRT